MGLIWSNRRMTLILEPIGPEPGRYRDATGLEYRVEKLEPGVENKI